MGGDDEVRNVQDVIAIGRGHSEGVQRAVIIELVFPGLNRAGVAALLAGRRSRARENPFLCVRDVVNELLKLGGSLVESDVDVKAAACVDPRAHRVELRDDRQDLLHTVHALKHGGDDFNALHLIAAGVNAAIALSVPAGREVLNLKPVVVPAELNRAARHQALDFDSEGEVIRVCHFCNFLSLSGLC